MVFFYGISPRASFIDVWGFGSTECLLKPITGVSLTWWQESSELLKVNSFKDVWCVSSNECFLESQWGALGRKRHFLQFLSDRVGFLLLISSTTLSKPRLTVLGKRGWFKEENSWCSCCFSCDSLEFRSFSVICHSLFYVTERVDSGPNISSMIL